MIKQLILDKLAIIDYSDTEFVAGFNALTGETGAGKSLMVTALLLLSGVRADYSLIRRGEKICTITGVFESPDNEDVKSILLEITDSTDASEIVITRELRESGVSRIFLNGFPISIKQLKSLSTHLLDIHSQHSHQKLFNLSHHIRLFDEAANYQDLLLSYRKVYKGLREKLRDLEKLKQELADAQKLFDYNKFVLQELDNVNPKENEEEELKKELDLLENSEIITNNSKALAELLYESEDSVYEKVKIALSFLKKLSDYNSDAQAYIKELEPILISTKEISEYGNSFLSGVEYNPFRIEEIRNRLQTLNKLYRKYGDFIELQEYRKSLAEQVEKVNTAEESMDLLQMDIADLVKKLSPIAKEISDARKSFAIDFSKNITDSIREMEILSGNFSVRIETRSIKDLYADAFDENGIDELEFLFTANAGEELKPMRETASGGEMSRIMVALKALSNSSTDASLVLDEIDTGISGEAGVKVGKKIQKIAQKQQIIAISHLPQIAAKSHRHIFVYKEEKDGKTFSQTKTLREDDKQLEIARLFSGASPSEAALQSAKELMES